MGMKIVVPGSIRPYFIYINYPCIGCEESYVCSKNEKEIAMSS